MTTARELAEPGPKPQGRRIGAWTLVAGDDCGEDDGGCGSVLVRAPTWCAGPVALLQAAFYSAEPGHTPQGRRQCGGEGDAGDIGGWTDTVVVDDCGVDDIGRRYSYSGGRYIRRWPEPGPAARDTIGRRPPIEQLAPVTAGRCSNRVLARIQLIVAGTDLAVIQLIVCAFSLFFFFFQYLGSFLPR